VLTHRCRSRVTDPASGAGPPQRGELLDLLRWLDPAAEPIAVIAVGQLL